MNYSDIGITFLIVLLVLFAAVRAGQLSPVGTGRLAKRMNALELKVAAQAATLDGVVEQVEAVAKAQGATREVLDAVRRELAADRGLTERTWQAVDRLQHFFIEDAFEARRQKDRV